MAVRSFPGTLPSYPPLGNERCVVLSQGETRPGVVHEQHLGQAPHPHLTPARRPDPRLSNPVVR